MKKNILLTSALLISCSIAFGQWVQQSSGFATDSRGITDISIVDADTVWALAYDGSGNLAPVQEFTKTLNGGALWTAGTVNGATGLDAVNICALTGHHAWAAMVNLTSGGGGIFRTMNGGNTWTKQTSATFSAPEGFPDFVHFFNSNNGLAMGDPNGGYFEIYTTTNGGNNWIRVPQANIPPNLTGEYGYLNVFSYAGGNVWFGTNKGNVYKSSDLGYNWTVAASGFSDMEKLEFRDDNNGLALYQGALKATTDGGSTWSDVNYTGTLYSSGLAYVPGTNSTYISTGAATGVSGSSISTDDGMSWVDLDNGIQHTAVAFLDNYTGWAGDFNTSPTSGGISKYSNTVAIQKNQSGKSSFSLYPNPSNGIFTLSTSTKLNANADLIIRDVLGKIVYRSEEQTRGTTYSKTLDLSAFSPGVYYISLTQGNEIINEKIVIQ